MEITEVRIDLPRRHYDRGDSRSALMACFSLIFDEEMAVHAIKLIQGREAPFLAMPNERKTDHCPHCQSKNHLLARYCSYCGAKLAEGRQLLVPPNKHGKTKIFDDLMHPLTNDLREYLLEECLEAYNQEKAQPGAILPLYREQMRRIG